MSSETTLEKMTMRRRCPTNFSLSRVSNPPINRRQTKVCRTFFRVVFFGFRESEGATPGEKAVCDQGKRLRLNTFAVRRARLATAAACKSSAVCGTSKLARVVRSSC